MFSHEMKEKIKQFAKEQAPYYLEEAEMTYMEKLRRKTGETKSKLMAKFAKFKSRSETAMEAENDMILYMSDYMKDLMEQGLSEQEAFERAKEELKFRSETTKSADLQERIVAHYHHMDIADYEAVGLFYGAFVFLGLSIGALVGFIGSGGWEMFLSGGWIRTLIGAIVGFLIGTGLGLLSNAIIVLKRKK